MVDSAVIRRAVELLRLGGVVALPTETVYGLGADAENELAVRRIFAIKNRPANHPLIVHIPGASTLGRWAKRIPPAARVLVDAFWPGPLTVVFERTERVSDGVTGGQDTVALRVPAHAVARELLEEFGGGIAAPSANRFGKVSPTTAEHVRQDLGDDVDLVLDGGQCDLGVESTIVDVTAATPRILRPGGLAKEAIEAALGYRVEIAERAEVRAPGMLDAHYAPRAGLLLAEPNELFARAQALHSGGRRVAALVPGAMSVPGGVTSFALPEDPASFAHHLYATLREIDAQGYEVIVACAPRREGLGLAVIDRLLRAAHSTR